MDARNEAPRPLVSTLANLVLHGALVLLALGLRLWNLGGRAMHHDESLHAFYSWRLFRGMGWEHDPMMHGPFLFHAIAAANFLFGDSDATSRLVPALLGTALVALPALLRVELGGAGALVASLLLTLSPPLLYYSRFSHHDLAAAFFTLGLVVCLARVERARDDARRERWVLASALALALLFTVKSVAYIHLFLFVVPVVVFSRGEWIEVLRRRRRLAELSPWPALALCWATLALPLGAAAIRIPARALGLDLPPDLARGPAGVPLGAGVFTILALGAVSLLIGRAAWGNSWLRLAALFHGTLALLYTSFLANPRALLGAHWSMLGYWTDQHEVHRGGQPWFYYLLLIGLYALVPALVTLLALLRPGLAALTRFERFLLAWGVGALVLYSFAGERMPWLVIHIVHPLLLFAGAMIGRWLQGLEGIDGLEGQDGRDFFRSGGGTLLAGLALFALAGLGFRRAAAATLRPSLLVALFLAGALLALAGLIASRARAVGRERALGATFLALAAALFALDTRSAFEVTYDEDRGPREMLVYTQTSSELPRVLAAVEAEARRSGEGKKLRITVDASDGFSWPWAWYLRDWPNVDYPQLDKIDRPPRGRVLLLDANNLERARPFLAAYGAGERYTHRQWRPEDYRDLDRSKVGALLADPTSRRRLRAHILWRDLEEREGRSEAYLFLPAPPAPPGPAPCPTPPSSTAPATP